MQKEQYTLEQYYSDLELNGLENTWLNIIKKIKDGSLSSDGILSVEHFGELYEIGLARTNKISKKEQGKYYTPEDVAKVMSEWFLDLKGDNICDVCCGTGNLILQVLDLLGRDVSRKVIADGHLYLYDQDELAIKICVTAIGVIYGFDVLDSINVCVGDFLDKDTVLPNNAKVIANPPYFHISKIEESWEETDVIKKSREFYAAMMEKIIKNSVSSVIITPYSFLGGTKFLPLRLIMNDYNGFIVSFDNVPGNIFSGKKHGIFNTNNTNSVRAAITVTENKDGEKGFKCSQLIRFRTDERQQLLDTNVLETFVGEKYQIVDKNNDKYMKCSSDLEPVFETWREKANEHIIKEYYSNNNTGQLLCIPNTCRYFSVASSKNLDRTGKIELYIEDKDVYDYLYCLLNSSFCYWHWRIYDGGITYAKNLLSELPDIFAILSDEDKKKLSDIANEMRLKENEYLSYKKNAGVMQENIKFPQTYRQKINNVILCALGLKEYSSSDIFAPIHANHIFEEEEHGNDE